VLIGEGPLKDEIAALGDKRIIMPGYMKDHGELARWLASADIYVSGMADETFGLSIVEAQASGLPVVGAAAGAMIDRVTPDMRVAQEEIFGPVLAMIEFDDLEQAAQIANRSQYGLVSGIWTRDINKAMSLASRIKAGQVYINTYGAGGGVELPFGGDKKSGYGREKGLESLASYTQVKNVCIKYA
jgi:glycosyltransferase involved in cell wall biosynthesis